MFTLCKQRHSMKWREQIWNKLTTVCKTTKPRTTHITSNSPHIMKCQTTENTNDRPAPQEAEAPIANSVVKHKKMQRIVHFASQSSEVICYADRVAQDAPSSSFTRLRMWLKTRMAQDAYLLIYKCLTKMVPRFVSALKLVVGDLLCNHIIILKYQVGLVWYKTRGCVEIL